jgi:hypothetical protein
VRERVTLFVCLRRGSHLIYVHSSQLANSVVLQMSWAMLSLSSGPQDHLNGDFIVDVIEPWIGSIVDVGPIQSDQEQQSQSLLQVVDFPAQLQLICSKKH